MNLDRHGGGCRCLLRIRENMGNPMISDEAFIEGHRGQYPDWLDNPGAADSQRLVDLAIELGLSSTGATSSDYDRILSLHRAGNAVLVCSSRPAAPGKEPSEQVSLVEEMDEQGLKLWVPTRDGFADSVSETRASFWDRGHVSAIVLHAPLAKAIA